LGLRRHPPRLESQRWRRLLLALRPSLFVRGGRLADAEGRRVAAGPTAQDLPRLHHERRLLVGVVRGGVRSRARCRRGPLPGPRRRGVPLHHGPAPSHRGPHAPLHGVASRAFGHGAARDPGLLLSQAR
jgi:hypothetical protein